MFDELPNIISSRDPPQDQMECPWGSKGQWRFHPEDVALYQVIYPQNGGWNRNIHWRSATGGATIGGFAMEATGGDPA